VIVLFPLNCWLLNSFTTQSWGCRLNKTSTAQKQNTTDSHKPFQENKTWLCSSFLWIIGSSAYVKPGVEITTRQLAKCEWNLELVSNFFKLPPAWQVASFFPPLIESFFSANWVLFLPDSKLRTRTWHGDLYRFIFMTHTHSHDVYFSSRASTDKKHTVQMFSKDMILATFSLIWRVKILSYSPVWRVPWKS
jgi:hypothetical protein